MFGYTGEATLSGWTVRGSSADVSCRLRLNSESKDRVPMAKPPPCPRCASGWPDEYTHHDCPAGTEQDDHRHWVCTECDHEWIEAVTAASP